MSGGQLEKVRRLDLMFSPPRRKFFGGLETLCGYVSFFSFPCACCESGVPGSGLVRRLGSITSSREKGIIQNFNLEILFLSSPPHFQWLALIPASTHHPTNSRRTSRVSALPQRNFSRISLAKQNLMTFSVAVIRGSSRKNETEKTWPFLKETPTLVFSKNSRFSSSKQLTMASRSGPRSVSDATRFTSTTPQPKSKTSAASNAGGPGPVGETLEQRVARLRAAHLAARSAPLSRYDRITEGGRKVFDVMHKATLAGLIGFTGMRLPILYMA